ncbi:glutamate ABC transporter substrate-binding protein [Streptomyces sp. VRA16 Mangrove soil]|uniref:glutamate ABC transporter substrate-binding protein n=1 Tax=Streptomyces sp. VRA16 Mangrove soil TaxID=2817434 RepID=UPI001A9CE9E3|nr:glutamate ABC transporter substrate-binding protein [Streptomyces sp. VRA16 Mangrove soil]MBO1334048.1 glutamate ABC transporter substrate-binding protein [Streptomyces sp. VRA16 Mangrove soil]
MEEQDARRVSLRGWGGVAAMAVAVVCALVAVFTVLTPLSHSAGGDGSTGLGSGGVADGVQARADDCAPDVKGEEPERSLDPGKGSQNGDAVKAIKDRGYLLVGVDQNSYRWGYRDPNKGLDSDGSVGKEATSELEGFDIDLAHEIAGEILGDPTSVHFRAIPTNQRIPAIKSGQVDMVVRTMTISCQRLKDVAFSTAYFQTGQQVLAPKASDIDGYDTSLGGKRICSAKGSTAELALTHDREKGTIPNSADIATTVPNQLDCLVRLQLGEVDAVVTDGALAASQAAQDPTVELKGKPFTKEFYGVAMKKGADDLVRRVNQVLEDYRKSGGGWQASYDKWLEPALGPSSGPPAPKYK